MADCNNLFAHYNGVIKLSDEKREVLRAVRDRLRNKMQTNYALLSVDETLEFHTQGSFIMDTIITPKDDDFDLDDGVYFIGTLTPAQRPPVQTFHDAVLYAVGENEDYAEVTDKDTCVRVSYSKEKFHIDLPIYYADSLENPNLAHLKDNWTLSNPVEFIDWFERKVMSGFKKAFLVENRMYTEYQRWLQDIRKADAQLRRIVRYLKGWADELRGDMPPGIVMTILAGENYRPNERDDIALRDTLGAIKAYLAANNFKCPRPTTPTGEDLFGEYSETRKQYFLDRLSTFVESAKQAIAIDNQKDACLKWQKHLGPRFPCSLAVNRVEGASTFASSSVRGDSARSA